jgi:hypothetical protein
MTGFGRREYTIQDSNRRERLAAPSNVQPEGGGEPGSPVLLDCFDQAPFAFNGTIGTTTINRVK